MVQTQLFYIATSKTKEFRDGGSYSLDWGNYGNWTSFKKPVADSTTSVTYDKTSKDSAGSSVIGGNGGVTVLGSSIPATAKRTVRGQSISVPVRYEVRGYTKYVRTSAMTKNKKMNKVVYTTEHPYQYRLQYRDKAVIVTDYSAYMNGMDFIFFADSYKADDGTITPTTGHLPHPTEFNVTYSDVRKNQDLNSNNSDGRDNNGLYILSNVRANVVTLNLKWEGLTSEQGADLLDSLNPKKAEKGTYDMVIVQYLDPATMKIQNKTFYCSERSVSKYYNGVIRDITVTLTEV